MRIRLSSFAAVTGIALLAGLPAGTTSARADDDAPGIARIDVLGSGGGSSVTSYDAVGSSDCNQCNQCNECGDGYYSPYGRPWDTNGYHVSQFRARNELCAARISQHIHDKLAYFHPTGSGGAGSPPFGHYHRTYPANPYYGDARDGRVYAAQGWGAPMAVPLAANVRHTYNYGWGIPSSRLTPVSRPLPFDANTYTPY